MAYALAVVVPAIALAVVLRLLGHVVLGRHTRARRVVNDYALWAVLPFVFVYLLFIAWPVALVFLLVAPVALLLVERFYFARNPVRDTADPR